MTPSPGDLPLWLVIASLTLNAIFLRRLLAKLDRLQAWIQGTPEQPGIADRVRHLEAMLSVEPIERRVPSPFTKDVS